MKNYLFSLIIIITVFVIVASFQNRCKATSTNNELCSYDTVHYTNLGVLKKNVLYIRDTIDLKGQLCILPENTTIDLRHGAIRNGCIVGKNNRIKGNRGFFEKINISGEWNVPLIKSSFFSDTGRVNFLKDILSLANPQVNNTIIIEDGNYYVQANSNWDECATLVSNSKLIINGKIDLIPNSFDGYSILKVNGSNIEIEGRGSINGDKYTHNGRTGEWGMGINILNSNHVIVKNLRINNCWGDCIYVGEKSSNIRIENCYLNEGRRQGVSVTSATNVEINNCEIKNVGGTLPEYGIDIEPNKNEKCDNIKIKKVSIINCKGGILVYGKARNANIGTVMIEQCNVKDATSPPLQFEKCESVYVKNCNIRPNRKRVYVYKDSVGYFNAIGTIIQ